MLTAAGIVSKVLGAIYRIPLGNILGTGGMGNYQLAHPIYTMLLLAITAGISVAVARMVAERVAKAPRRKPIRFFSCLFVFGGFGSSGLYAALF